MYGCFVALVLAIGLADTVPAFAYDERALSYEDQQLQLAQVEAADIRSTTTTYLENRTGRVSQLVIKCHRGTRENHTTPKGMILLLDDEDYSIVSDSREDLGELQQDGHGTRDVHCREEAPVHHESAASDTDDSLPELIEQGRARKQALFRGIAASSALCILAYGIGDSYRRSKRITRPGPGKASEAPVGTKQSASLSEPQPVQEHQYDTATITEDICRSMERLLKDRWRYGRIGYPARIPHKSVADLFGLGPVMSKDKNRVVDERVPILPRAQNTCQHTCSRDLCADILRNEGYEVSHPDGINTHDRQVVTLYVANTSRRYAMSHGYVGSGKA